MDKLLKQIYYGDKPDEPGFMGTTRLYQIAKKYDKKIRLSDVKSFLARQKEYVERTEVHDNTKGQSQRYFHTSWTVATASSRYYVLKRISYGFYVLLSNILNKKTLFQGWFVSSL